MQSAFPLFMTHVQIEKLLQFQEKGGHNKNTHCDKNQKRPSIVYDDVAVHVQVLLLFLHNGHLVIIVAVVKIFNITLVNESTYDSCAGSVLCSVLKKKNKIKNLLCVISSDNNWVRRAKKEDNIYKRISELLKYYYHNKKSTIQ